jgi:hypothetical protein
MTRQMVIGDDRAGQAWRSAGSYLKQFFSATPRQKSRLAKKKPLAELHTAALAHPDPFTRRDCLGFLDHYANEASTAVFAAALRDPVDFVRNVALHSIACESCRTEELCVADVVPDIIGVLEADPALSCGRRRSRPCSGWPAVTPGLGRRSSGPPETTPTRSCAGLPPTRCAGTSSPPASGTSVASDVTTGAPQPSSRSAPDPRHVRLDRLIAA